MMGTTQTGPTNTHMEAVRHKIDKSNLSDAHVRNTTVTYEGRDNFLNHWITITPNDADREQIVDDLRTKIQGEYRANVQGFTPFDPLQHFFSNNSIKCRLAKTGNFSIHENEKSTDVTKNPCLYDRHELTTQKNIEQEEKSIRDILEYTPNGGTIYTFDVDISFAGALICAEGPLASIVCRKLYRRVQAEEVCEEVFTMEETEAKDLHSLLDV